MLFAPTLSVRLQSWRQLPPARSQSSEAVFSWQYPYPRNASIQGPGTSHTLIFRLSSYVIIREKDATARRLSAPCRNRKVKNPVRQVHIREIAGFTPTGNQRMRR